MLCGPRSPASAWPMHFHEGPHEKRKEGLIWLRRAGGRCGIHRARTAAPDQSFEITNICHWKIVKNTIQTETNFRCPNPSARQILRSGFGRARPFHKNLWKYFEYFRNIEIFVFSHRRYFQSILSKFLDFIRENTYKFVRFWRIFLAKITTSESIMKQGPSAAHGILRMLSWFLWINLSFVSRDCLEVNLE